MDSNKLRTANSFVENVSEITEILKINNIPANRIFDTIMTQMKDLQDQIQEKKGSRASISDLEEIEEKMEVLESLSDVYLEGVGKNKEYQSKAENQIDAVKRTKKFVLDYKESISRYKGIMKRNEEKIGKETDSLAYDKLASLTERADFMESILKKSTESAVTSLKMMESLVQDKKNMFTEQEKNTIRYGLASNAIAERVLLGGEEIQDLRTRVRREGEFEKMVTMVAESKSFQSLTEENLSPDGVRDFLKEPESGKKLWKEFEKKVRENQKDGKTRELSGKTVAKTNGKRLEKKMQSEQERKAEKKQLEAEKEMKKKKEMKKELKPKGMGMN